MITSRHNPRVKSAAALRTRKHRAQQRRFLIDGAREIRRAAAAGIELVEVFYAPALLHAELGPAALSAVEQTPADRVEVSAEVFAKLAFGDRHDGLVAVAATPETTLDQLSVADDAVVAVVEGVEKPGNLGAILRSADGAGIAAVIAVGSGTDLFNPNTVRASLGTLFALPVAAASVEATQAWLRDRGWPLYAARPDATQLYTEMDVRRGAAFLLGSEAEGLSSAWNTAQVQPIRLPMRGMADSLNVSVTAAVLFYEALRQRTA